MSTVEHDYASSAAQNFLTVPSKRRLYRFDRGLKNISNGWDGVKMSTNALVIISTTTLECD